MNWLALRLLRPYLAIAAVVTAAASTYILYGSGVVKQQLVDAGVPDCLDPNVCYPHGGAMDAVFGMELVAAFVPSLIGLVLGVGLFAPEREHDTIAFVLTQSSSRGRWVLTKFGWALAAGLACTGTVATLHRLVATRYTVLANDTYEMLQLLHLNNVGYMAAQTLLLIAFGGVVGLSQGRILPTLALSVLGGPFVFLGTTCLAVSVAYPLALLIGDPQPKSDTTHPFTDDISAMDPFGYLVSGVAGVVVVVLVLFARRLGTRVTAAR